MLESSDMLVLATRHWHRAKYANSVVAGPTKIKTCCFFRNVANNSGFGFTTPFIEKFPYLEPTTVAWLYLGSLPMPVAPDGPHPGAWWGAWHPPKLQSHRGASKQPFGPPAAYFDLRLINMNFQKGTRAHTAPPTIESVETSIIAQIETRAVTSASCPGQKARQGTASAAHNRPQRRSEPLSNQKGQGATPFSNSWTYIYY